ncbi:Lipopolysaccharide biosynthesis protein, LPS:glycosyltransferase [Terribacillus aidingensis]|uniref:Lipopolysaccharide biosynthesis protein, LPS:glycosyltransferase n=1 Tax=Terribacillus aidingensis TaxID=586416 RepID=A0A285P4S1_9BACI|nr:glycosyltransferase family 8 protein [Terribacillus aidingensis]SNZ16267.1 Lipopolysaccharide biosynthesis protein, LPS:glycosyltransferase [Terribacillus aidingensis]
MKKKMHIVSSTDDNYAQHLGVTLSSLLENTATPEDFVISVIDGGISEQKKQLLLDTAAAYNTPLHYLEVDLDAYDGAIASRHISKAAYYRISIPDMMDQSIERTLYVDCDMLIFDDVKKLFDIDMEGNIVAAVSDYGEHNRLPKMGITSEDRYFNSGLLLIDMQAWRDHNMTDKVLTFIDENPDKLAWHDQDALNALLWDKWLILHPKWNAQAHVTLKEYKAKSVEEERTLRTVRGNPAIVHFTGADKPWQEGCTHPYTEAYYAYLAKTPFSHKFNNSLSV